VFFGYFYSLQNLEIAIYKGCGVSGRPKKAKKSSNFSIF